MPLFRLEGDELVIAQETNLELESHLEDWLENSPEALAQEPIFWLGRQPSATVEEGTIFPDLLGVDAGGNLIIVELKRNQASRDTIAQLLDYAAWADGLSDEQIYEIVTTYFENHCEFKGKAFDDVFNSVFETDEVPVLNQKLRLFIVAEEIPPTVLCICRFLRTSYGMDINCLAVSTFKTESGEKLVNIETSVGDEDILTIEVQMQPASERTRWSSDKGVRQVVLEAGQELMQGDKETFAPKEVFAHILKKYPDFKVGTVHGQLAAGCPNHGSHHRHLGDYKYYWRVGHGKYRLYDREKDGVESNGRTN